MSQITKIPISVIKETASSLGYTFDAIVEDTKSVEWWNAPKDSTLHDFTIECWRKEYTIDQIKTKLPKNVSDVILSTI